MDVFFNKNHIFGVLFQTPLVVLEIWAIFLFTFAQYLERSIRFGNGRICLESAGLDFTVRFLKIHFGKIITDKKLFELRLIIKKQDPSPITNHQLLTNLNNFQKQRCFHPQIRLLGAGAAIKKCTLWFWREPIPIFHIVPSIYSTCQIYFKIFLNYYSPIYIIIKLFTENCYPCLQAFFCQSIHRSPLPQIFTLLPIASTLCQKMMMKPVLEALHTQNMTNLKNPNFHL